jgi:ribA/ribD-fused uncharacterized protein
MKTENGFREEFSFLSNFTYFDKPMVLHREVYTFVFKTNEHFYQACKFQDFDMIAEVGNHPSKGLKKFINSKKSEWRKDWDDIKLNIMRVGLKYKFSDHNPKLKQMLLDTGDIELVEYNYWNDKFWGVCKKTEEGENHLGKLLMEIRDNLRNNR